MNRLTHEEIEFLVGQVIVGKKGPLDYHLTRAIFGGKVPKTWGEWPTEAVEVWSYGCDLYHKLKTSGVRNPQPRVVLTVELSWKLILGLAPNIEQWWKLPGVTWLDIGVRLGMTPRKAAYRMTTLGWRMTGSGMGVPGRRVVAAPCIVCSAVWTPREMKNSWGPCCEEYRQC